MKRYVYMISCMILVPFMCTASFANVPSGSNKINITVKPFTVTAEKKLDYLEEALPQLVGARLYKKGKIAITPYSGQTTADSSGYLLQGALTQTGNALSLSADLTSGEETENFQVSMQNAESEGQIITLINQLCAQINTKLLGRTPAAQMETTGQETELYNIHLHPDNLIHQLDLDKK